MSVNISFLNEKGGVGKTTSVLEFAAQLGENGFRVLIIDLDPQINATLRISTLVKVDKNIVSVLSDFKNNKIVDAIFKTKKEWRNCYYIPGSKSWSNVERIFSSTASPSLILKKAISQIEKSFDFILFDLPPAINRITMNALIASHYYILPTDLSEDSFQGILSIEGVVNNIFEDGLNNKLKRLGVLITRFQKGISLDVRALIDKINNKFKDNLFIDIKIPDTTKIIKSQREKFPLSTTILDNSASKIYAEAVKKILERIKLGVKNNEQNIRG